MAFSSAEPVRVWNAHRHFLAHLITMPGWHKAVLVVGALLAFGGGIGRIAGATRQPANAPASQPQQSATDAPKSSFAGDSTPPAADKPLEAQREPDGSLLIRLSPHAMAIGLSLVAGFLIAWVFRAFLKTMALLALVVTGGLFALSYFGVLNVDLSSAKQEYTSVIHWLGDQAGRLKDVAMAHLPSSGGGAVGAWLGLRRR
jgi:uncharacterized membrane protein (Fun14 family)